MGFLTLPAVAALVGALLIQVGANLANDYFDYVKGVDIPERKKPDVLPRLDDALPTSAWGSLSPLP